MALGICGLMLVSMKRPGGEELVRQALRSATPPGRSSAWVLGLRARLLLLPG